MPEKLRSGYTTGTHASAVLGAVLKEYYLHEKLTNIEVFLPKSNAKIDVKREAKYHFSSIKVDNDDLDVTKGCCIHAELFFHMPKGLKAQTPSSIKVKNTNIFIYGGHGVGIVTKAGLKIQPNYPAINPVPLKMMRQVAMGIVEEKTEENLHIVLSIDNGEEIAKQTANKKVGVIGGISILGTRGIVKPISADAYLDSIEAEVSVANALGFSEIVFTLGNTAHDYANKYYDVTQVVEIGNFIYDGASRLKNSKFKKMIFISSVAKMCKIAQENKNTHNRFGGIDFDEVKLWLKQELDFDLGKDEYLTLKAVLQTLTKEKTKLFVDFLGYKASQSFKKWFIELEVNIKEIEIITLNTTSISKRKIKW